MLRSLVTAQATAVEADTAVTIARANLSQPVTGQDDVSFHDVEDDDMAEIVAKEAWLASLESQLPDDPLEPDEAWFEWRTAA